MSFNTDALLYPLTKGDKRGHEFHGNQYQQVASEGKETRPPVGKLQLSPDEIKSVAKILSPNPYFVTQETMSRRFEETSVSVAKTLGGDKPAIKVAQLPEVAQVLYRGCDAVGAKSLTEPLKQYSGGGGTSDGFGVYTTPSAGFANNYLKEATDEGRDGVLVKIALDPSAKILDSASKEYSKVLRDCLKTIKTNDDLSATEKERFISYASYPAHLALLCGYQGTSSIVSTVVTDRSIMKVQY
jgi:hypothetical protein